MNVHEGYYCSDKNVLNQITVMVQFSIFTKDHYVVHFTWMNFMVCKLCLNKVVKKEATEGF